MLRNLSHANGFAALQCGGVRVYLSPNTLSRARNPSRGSSIPMPVCSKRLVMAGEDVAMPCPAHAPHWTLLVDSPHDMRRRDSRSSPALAAL